MEYYTKNPDGSIRFSGSPAGLKIMDPDHEPHLAEEEIIKTDAGHFFASQCPAPPPPTQEERRAEILARLDALSAELLPKDYTVINAFCGDAEAKAIIEAKREAHETAAAPLRAELAALAGSDDEVTE